MTTEQEDLRHRISLVRDEVGRAVVGQHAAVSGLMVCLLARGHALLEGVPGVGKTLLVRTLSTALGIDTKRIQFTADLMPGDVTGSSVWDQGANEFVFRPGPVFTNFLLADEINRTPPKTQSALLEAMEERQVTVDGRTMPLPRPFIVAATMNPVEYEGTYSLPEAQLDRFLMKLELEAPGRQDECEMLRRHANGFSPRDLGAAGVRAVVTPDELVEAQQAVERVRVSDDVVGYAVDLVRATRSFPSVRLGVSPRGATLLNAAAKAWAWLTGFDAVTPDHVQEMAIPVLRHRLQLRSEAELEGVTGASVIDSVLRNVRVPV